MSIQGAVNQTLSNLGTVAAIAMQPKVKEKIETKTAAEEYGKAKELSDIRKKAATEPEEIKLSTPGTQKRVDQEAELLDQAKNNAKEAELMLKEGEKAFRRGAISRDEYESVYRENLAAQSAQKQRTEMYNKMMTKARQRRIKQEDARKAAAESLKVERERLNPSQEIIAQLKAAGVGSQYLEAHKEEIESQI